MDLSKWNRQPRLSTNMFASVALLMVATPATLAHEVTPLAGHSYGTGTLIAQGNPNGNPNTRQTDPALIKQWFGNYDRVRRQAQMTPQERAKADDLLSHGLQMFVPGEEKIVAHNLLTNLVSKYDTACSQLKALPFYPETSGLHRQYFEYFKEAKDLFSDYLRVQNNLMVKDQQGKSVMAGLIERKANLENTEQQAKAMDNDTRNRFGIPPYRY